MIGHIEQSSSSLCVLDRWKVAQGELRSFVVADATGGVFGVAEDSNAVQRRPFKRYNAQNKRFNCTNLESSLARVRLLLLVSIRAGLSTRRLSARLSLASGHFFR